MRQAELRVAGTAGAERSSCACSRSSATLDSARYDLSKVRIESPIDGIVTRRNIEEGETVVIGTMNNAGTVLLTIADMSVIEAEVEVDETDIPSVQIGQTAKVTIDAMPGKTFTAQGDRNRQQPDSGSRAAAARQHAGDELQGRSSRWTGRCRKCGPGFTCTAEITTATRENVLSPCRFRPRPCAKMVVDEKGKIVREPADAGEASPAARRRCPGVRTEARTDAQGNRRRVRRPRRQGEFVPVKTGIAGEKYFEMLSGLKEGDQVVIGPFSSVRELARRRGGQGGSRRPGGRRGPERSEERAP